MVNSNSYFAFKKRAALSVTLATMVVCSLPAKAEEPHTHHRTIDWQKLSLTSQQSDQIHQLEDNWQAKYQRLQPEIAQHKQKLKTLFADPKSDPVEIVATEQSLMRLQEQLRNEAMTSYLRKRAILNNTQQHQLEIQVHQMVIDCQNKNCAPKAQPDDPNSGIRTIIQKIQWAIEPH